PRIGTARGRSTPPAVRSGQEASVPDRPHQDRHPIPASRSSQFLSSSGPVIPRGDSPRSLVFPLAPNPTPRPPALGEKRGPLSLASPCRRKAGSRVFLGFGAREEYLPLTSKWFEDSYGRRVD